MQIHKLRQKKAKKETGRQVKISTARDNDEIRQRQKHGEGDEERESKRR